MLVVVYFISCNRSSSNGSSTISIQLIDFFFRFFFFFYNSTVSHFVRRQQSLSRALINQDSNVVKIELRQLKLVTQPSFCPDRRQLLFLSLSSRRCSETLSLIKKVFRCIKCVCV